MPLRVWAREAAKRGNAAAFKEIVDALLNMVASQSEDNHHAIIQFVVREMRKELDICTLFFSVQIACERNKKLLNKNSIENSTFNLHA